MINVQLPPFDAKGDGVADDTAAIRAAIAAVPSCGGEVLFPPGTYRVCDELVIDRSGVSLRGMCRSSADTTKGAWIQSVDPTRDVIRVDASNATVEAFDISDLSITGGLNGINATNTNPANTIMRFALRNIVALGCAEHGIKLDTQAGYVFDCILDNLLTLNSIGDGLHIGGDTSQVKLRGLWSAGNGGYQLALIGDYALRKEVKGVDLLGVVIGSGGVDTSAVLLRHAFNVQLPNAWFESVLGWQMTIDSCRGIYLTGGNIAQADDARGINLTTSAALPMCDIFIDIPGWTNGTHNKHLTLDLAGTSTLSRIYLGGMADGPFRPANIENFVGFFQADQIYFRH